MKSLLISIALAFFVFVSAKSQDDAYYWALGRKYYLKKSTERQYVLTRLSEKTSIAKSLGILDANLSNFEALTINSAINEKSPNKEAHENFYWGFIDEPFDKSSLMSDDFVYAAPTFLINGREIGLSQYFYVKLKQKSDLEILELFAIENKVEIVGNDKFMPLWFILSCTKNSKGNALEMANVFYESGNFESADPDFMENLSSNCASDPLFSEQWHLNNTGQAGGTVGNDVKACEAWNITTGCANVIVAVLDHGLEFNHPDFNNISPVSFDTQNGTQPSVVRGVHGVIVGGVIGASRNNGIGVSGLSPGVQLMSISNSLDSTPLSRQQRAAGINFAWQNGAAIINNSWGSTVVEPIINDAIQNAVTLGRNGLGTIVVFATGNSNNNTISYPSNIPSTISVGSIERTPVRASFSNYGTGLDVVAPGASIRTTDRQGTLGLNQTSGPNGDYTIQSGTSYSAPQVAGIAAMILSVNPNLTLQQVRDAIENSAEKVGPYLYSMGGGERPNLTWNNQMGYGRVNAFKALQTAFPITGPSLICSTGTFNIQNLPSGRTITWSTNTSGLSINSMTGQATRQNNYNGPATINATVTGGCSTSLFTYNIWVGNPSASSSTLIFPTGLRGVNPVTLSPSSVYQFSIDPVNGFPLSYNWILPNGFSFFSGNNTSTPSIMTSFTEGNYTLTCLVSNACGSSFSNSLNIILGTGGGPPLRIENNVGEPSAFEGNVINMETRNIPYPNPTSEIVYFEVDSMSYITLMNATGKELVSTSGIGKMSFSVTDLPSGVYLLIISNKKGVKLHKILVSR
jgi:hypothetical protein